MNKKSLASVGIAMMLCCCSGYKNKEHVEDAAVADEQLGEIDMDHRAAMSISLYTANKFHKRLTRATKRLNPALRVYYEGPLGRPGGEPGPASDAFADWNIVEAQPEGPARLVCNISVSETKRDATIAQCNLEDRILYMAIRDVNAESEELDLSRAELNGQSVRKFVANLSK
ncbi:MAG: hypothetical protein ISR77_18825 [Pirellulaceae bacterium]|nr:hypothetical protein [Pirellulaceae bacterium]